MDNLTLKDKLEFIKANVGLLAFYPEVGLGVVTDIQHRLNRLTTNMTPRGVALVYILNRIVSGVALDRLYIDTELITQLEHDVILNDLELESGKIILDFVYRSRIMIDIRFIKIDICKDILESILQLSD